MTAGQIPLIEEVGDPRARREADFYETQRWQVDALLARLPLNPAWTYLEPCAGELALVRPLRARGLTVWANDLVQRTARLDSTLDARTVGLYEAVGVFLRRVDVVITNVPFVDALPIISLAVDQAHVAVVSLLRSTWDEPTEDRGEWLKDHPPTAQIAMPRADYRGTGSSESASHHWFIWARDPNFVPWSHETVTQGDRDALIAADRLREFQGA